MGLRPQIIGQRPDASTGPTDRGFRSDWELRLWWFAVATIGLHLIIDNYLQPEPGIAAGDHVLSGGVAMGILIAVAGVSCLLPAG